MKRTKKKYQLILILLLSLLAYSCEKELKSNTQKTPVELSDEARIKQNEMDDSIKTILSMKRELNRLRKITAKRPCNCKPRTFNVKSKYAWVKFDMPAGKNNQKISVRNGSYKNQPFSVNLFACSRVYWSNLTFQCNPKSCKWEKVSGSWRTSNQCMGSPPSSGKIKYVKTGVVK